MAKKDLIQEALDKGFELVGNETVKELEAMLAKAESYAEEFLEKEEPKAEKTVEAIEKVVGEVPVTEKPVAEEVVESVEKEADQVALEIEKETKANYEKLKKYYEATEDTMKLEQLISSHPHLED